MPLGCSNDEEEFQYDREDMEAAVFGTWTGSYTLEGSTAVPLTLDIRARDDVARAPACNQRSFSEQSATPGLELRCGSGSSLAVSATLVVDGDDSPTEFTGYFDVNGLTFTGGYLSLQSSSEALMAELHDGAWRSCRHGEGAATDASCTLDARVEE
jgi:hypothetical protein